MRPALPMLALASTLCLTIAGCSSVPRADAATADAMDPDAYPAVFDAARDALSEFRFTLDRVDAARGVITTRPKQTAGLATPWDAEQTNAGQEFSDLAHQHERVVRVTFEPAGEPARISVEVVIDRVRRPNWRVETDAIGWSTHARDPVALRSGVAPEYRQPVSEDRALAARILARINELAGRDPEPAVRTPGG